MSQPEKQTAAGDGLWRFQIGEVPNPPNFVATDACGQRRVKRSAGKTKRCARSRRPRHPGAAPHINAQAPIPPSRWNTSSASSPL